MKKELSGVRRFYQDLQICFSPWNTYFINDPPPDPFKSFQHFPLITWLGKETKLEE